jgi:PleD family two-component response regulator
MENRSVSERGSKCFDEFFKPRLPLADDDLDDLRRYSKRLNYLGYNVRSFTSYSTAATCLALENFDLVIVSQGTPNFEGRQVVARAIEHDRHTACSRADTLH